MERRTRRDWRPTLERMEPRELLSGITAVLASHRAPIRFDTGGNVNPPTRGEGQPTARTLARERFSAAFGGPYSIGPGMFTDQAFHIYARGVGGSSAFLHGNYQMSIVIPKDPTQPITGVVSMFDRNINSGGIVGIDLTGSRTDVDRVGRPTHLTYVADQNLSAGLFAEPEINGVVDIRYTPSGKPTPGGFEHGTATAVFRALIFTVGTNNPLRNSDLVQRGGRVARRA